MLTALAGAIRLDTGGLTRPRRHPGRPGLQTMKTTKSKTKQVFAYTAPSAMSVMLAGDFTHWQKNAIPMRKQKGGVWKISVELEPGTHHYRFLVDGEWQDDPECELKVPNPYGGQNAVRQVS